ncbi:hypothetical protein CPC08DRAFT_708400 [Agrocybe pediades]|nr:hypothetical protein CPC08DRAFT_708400 [Agrocybe pediades]
MFCLCLVSLLLLALRFVVSGLSPCLRASLFCSVPTPSVQNVLWTPYSPFLSFAPDSVCKGPQLGSFLFRCWGSVVSLPLRTLLRMGCTRSQ